ncbi:MAG: ABC transporter permease [Firmicutes bacterium]|nr:ABC transporter permease [Bacillota bacterium]
MFLAKIAFRNLSRHRLRTFVSILAIAFSVLIVVFARGYVTGMVDATVADHIYYDSGHIKISHEEYLAQRRLLPLDYPIDSLTDTIAALQTVENVDMVVPRLRFGAMVSTGEELVAMNGWGVDPAKEMAFTDIADYLVEGRMAVPGQLEVVMGTRLLEEIDRQVGDKVTVAFNTAFNSLSGATFTIVGRIQSGMKLLDEYVFLLPLDEAQRLLYMDDQATELLVVTPDLRLVDATLPKVRDLLASRSGDYVALGYRETSDLIPFMDLAKLIYNQIYIFLVLLACVVVVNTMIMIVRERTREIGMMAALGLEGKDITGLFLVEGGIMGISGSLIGALLGFFLTKHFAEVGIDFTSALSGMSQDIVINAIIRPTASLSNTIFAFVLGIVIVTLACMIPARKAARLEPTEAMRAV